MGATAVTAIIVRREQDLVAHFRAKGALDATHAMTPAALGVDTQLAWEILLRRGTIREAAPGSYYLDEASWEAARRRNRRMALIMMTFALAVIVFSALVLARS